VDPSPTFTSPRRPYRRRSAPTSPATSTTATAPQQQPQPTATTPKAPALCRPLTLGRARATSTISMATPPPVAFFELSINKESQVGTTGTDSKVKKSFLYFCITVK